MSDELVSAASGRARIKFLERNGTTNVAGAAAFALLVVLLGVRLTRGVDFSDESYYALYIDDWLKGSIATSTLLSIQQTAALIVYPASLLYTLLTGSSDGLFLFLRFLFLIGAAASASFWIIFLQRLGHRWMAWGGGILVLAFVPFGLPAPSYNTIGQQALTIALASFGCAALVEHRRQQFCWLAISACAWAVTTVAYPPLIAPCGCLCLLGLFHRDGSFPRPCLYAILVGSAICIAWFAVALSLSPNRFHDSIVFSLAIHDHDVAVRKLKFAIDRFQGNIAFSILFVIAIFNGLTSGLFPRFSRILFAVVIVSLFAIAPALFVRSHDAITLAALMGLGLLSGLRAGASRTERVIAYVYLTSLIAALTTCAAAFNSVFNFCIGGVPAAALAAVGRPAPKSSGLVGLLPLSAAILAVLPTSLFFYYGELPEMTASPRREIMANGFFAGLALNPGDTALIRLVQNSINPLLKPNQTVAIGGRLPGLLLAMPARVSMPHTFPLPPILTRKLLEKTEPFYRKPEHQPSLVLVYRDNYVATENPIPHFDERYAVEANFKAPLGELGVFRRR